MLLLTETGKEHKISCGYVTIDSGSDDLIPVVAALHDQMHTWREPPYGNGSGTEQSGVDCSGFVWRTLKDRFNLPMERITTPRAAAHGRAGQ